MTLIELRDRIDRDILRYGEGDHEVFVGMTLKGDGGYIEAPLIIVSGADQQTTLCGTMNGISKK